MKLGVIIDNRKCIGRHACTAACKSEYDAPVGVNRTWVKYVEKGTFPATRRIFTVHRCNHCEDPPCLEICPVTSLFIQPDGIVDFDPRRCIGCKACLRAAPEDTLTMRPQRRPCLGGGQVRVSRKTGFRFTPTTASQSSLLISSISWRRAQPPLSMRISTGPSSASIREMSGKKRVMVPHLISVHFMIDYEDRKLAKCNNLNQRRGKANRGILCGSSSHAPS